jgi:ABC-type glycerol-3-phosphate transport system permease component
MKRMVSGLVGSTTLALVLAACGRRAAHVLLGRLAVSLGLYIWNSNTTAFPEFYPLVITGSFVSVLPLLAAFIGLQRFWRSGLTAGSVK